MILKDENMTVHPNTDLYPWHGLRLFAYTVDLNIVSYRNIPRIFPSCVLMLLVALTLSAMGQPGSSTASYTKFTGVIGTDTVVVDLIWKGAQISGFYYYKQTGILQKLSGWHDSTNHFTINEYDEGGLQTATLTGNKMTASAISGTWTNTITHVTAPFSLTETPSGTAHITFHEQAASNCKSNTSKADTSKCTTVEVDYLTVSTPVTSASNQINEALIQLVSGAEYSSVDAMLADALKTPDDESFHSTVSCILLTNDNNILSVQNTVTILVYGVAEPVMYTILRNFNLQTGKPITLQDLFLPNYEYSLNRIGERHFTRKNGATGWNFQPGHFELTTNFAVLPGGLLFQFNPYQLVPYSMGMPTVFIPYHEIRDLLKPGVLPIAWQRTRSK